MFDQRWFCHADDDNYLNIKRLYEVLADYDPDLPWYIGRISTSSKVNLVYKDRPVEFNFATGGASFCLSYPLIAKLAPYLRYFNHVKKIFS